MAKHAGKERGGTGELINCSLDLVLANDITAPVAIKEFSRLGQDHVFDPERVALVPDHFTPNKDIKSAEQSNYVRQFARSFKITNYFEVGRMGIEHCLLPEQGLVLPGDMVIGADSHTCTYGDLVLFPRVWEARHGCGALGECWFKVPESMKFVYHGKLRPGWGKDPIPTPLGTSERWSIVSFHGIWEAIENLCEGRLTMCNMAVEQVQNGIVPPDEKTKAYVEKGRRGLINLYK